MTDADSVISETQEGELVLEMQKSGFLLTAHCSLPCFRLCPLNTANSLPKNARDASGAQLGSWETRSLWSRASSLRQERAPVNRNHSMDAPYAASGDQIPHTATSQGVSPLHQGSGLL